MVRGEEEEEEEEEKRASSSLLQGTMSDECDVSSVKEAVQEKRRHGQGVGLNDLPESGRRRRDNRLRFHHPLSSDKEGQLQASKEPDWVTELRHIPPELAKDVVLVEAQRWLRAIRDEIL